MFRLFRRAALTASLALASVSAFAQNKDLVLSPELTPAFGKCAMLQADDMKGRHYIKYEDFNPNGQTRKSLMVFIKDNGNDTAEVCDITGIQYDTQHISPSISITGEVNSKGQITIKDNDGIEPDKIYPSIRNVEYVTDILPQLKPTR